MVEGCVKGKLASTTWRFRVIHYFIAHCCVHMPAPLVDSTWNNSNLNPFYYCPSIYTLVTQQHFIFELSFRIYHNYHKRVGTLIVATIYLQLIQKRYMFQSFTVLQCSHQHCVQPVASDVEVVGYL